MSPLKGESSSNCLDIGRGDSKPLNPYGPDGPAPGEIKLLSWKLHVFFGVFLNFKILHSYWLTFNFESNFVSWNYAKRLFNLVFPTYM